MTSLHKKRLVSPSAGAISWVFLKNTTQLLLIKMNSILSRSILISTDSISGIISHVIKISKKLVGQIVYYKFSQNGMHLKILNA